MAKVIEEWRPVAGFEGLYEVSNIGRVRSLTRYKKVIKPIVTNSGYYQYQLWRGGICRTGLAHRLVAQAFIPNTGNKPMVNHIDENKLNNSVDNLEWVSHVENCRYGTAIARRTEHLDYSKRRINNAGQIAACSIPVAQFTKDGEFVRNWASASECARENGWQVSNIRRSCTADHATAYGFIFKEVR